MVAALRPIYSLTDSTTARTILVYRNGDSFYMGKKFVLNHRYVPNFEALMIQLNECVPTPFGVRTIYTPQNGHTVVDLDTFQQGGRYVVAGRERFKKIDYFNIRAPKPQARKRDEVIRPVVHSSIQVPSKWHSFYNKPRYIYVFTNGDILIQPMKILIPKFTLNNWNRVLGLINEKVILRTGGIHRLYTLRGQLVHGPDELEDNQYYVACGREKFKALPYLRNSNIPEYSRQYCKSTAPSYVPEKKLPSVEPSKLKRPVEVGRGDIPSVYLAKPEKASPEKAPTALSSDDGRSVYKAGRRRTETEGAKDIPEDKNVKVDVPVEQAPAEIVNDEDIYYIPGTVEEKGDILKKNKSVQTTLWPELSSLRRKLHQQYAKRTQAPAETVSNETVHFSSGTNERKAPAATVDDEDLYDNDLGEAPPVPEDFQDDDVYSYVENTGGEDYHSSPEDSAGEERVSASEDIIEEQPVAPGKSLSDEDIHFTSDSDEGEHRKKKRPFKKWFSFVFNPKKKDARKSSFEELD